MTNERFTIGFMVNSITIRKGKFAIDREAQKECLSQTCDSTYFESGVRLVTEINHNLKRTLLRLISIEHEQLSYRKIAKLSNNPIVTGQTIGRIHKSMGKWMPKTKKILSALGVISTKEKRISDMSPEELLWRLENRK